MFSIKGAALAPLFRHHIPSSIAPNSVVTNSSMLNPSYATIATIRSSIQNTLKTDLPSEMLINAISPFLISVNQWSTQIPSMLDGVGSPASVNLVFAIRKDLFVAPQFTQTVMGTALADLPAPFQEFNSFIHKLIDAQKTDKVPSKVISLFVV